MEDEQIVGLFWARDESAIAKTEEKYGKALMRMAWRILSDLEDCRECVNDAYLKAWNAIPPTKPKHLSAYLYKIVRTISIDRFRSKKSQKRKASEYATSLEELHECIAGEETPYDMLEMDLLIRTIEDYLRMLPQQKRQMFLCRYYFLDSTKKIAGYFHISEAKTKSTLHRIRSGLKEYLQQEGFFL